MWLSVKEDSKILQFSEFCNGMYGCSHSLIFREQATREEHEVSVVHVVEGVFETTE